jgi:cyanophycin synthetase
VDAALRMASPGDVVLVLYEKVDAMLGLLRDLGAVPAEAGLVAAG